MAVLTVSENYGSNIHQSHIIHAYINMQYIPEKNNRNSRDVTSHIFDHTTHNALPHQSCHVG